MSHRSRKIAAADGPAEAEVSDTNLTSADMTQGSPESSTAHGVSAAQERARIAPESASGKVAPRPGSKLSLVLGLLESPEGASLVRLVEVTGWLPHTTRAALTGLRKRGYVVSSEKAKGADERSLSIYRVTAGKVAS